MVLPSHVRCGTPVARQLVRAGVAPSPRVLSVQRSRVESCVRSSARIPAATSITWVTTSQRCSFTRTSPGAGYNNVYRLRLPKDPPLLPKQDGSGGTWNFQLHPAFWFGMAMCDDQGDPNPGGSPSAGPNIPCTPDATATSSTAPTRPRPTTSGGTRARHSWRCSSTRRDGSPALNRPGTRRNGPRH